MLSFSLRVLGLGVQVCWVLGFRFRVAAGNTKASLLCKDKWATPGIQNRSARARQESEGSSQQRRPLGGRAGAEAFGGRDY